MNDISFVVLTALKKFMPTTGISKIFLEMVPTTEQFNFFCHLDEPTLDIFLDESNTMLLKWCQVFFRLWELDVDVLFYFIFHILHIKYLYFFFLKKQYKIHSIAHNKSIALLKGTDKHLVFSWCYSITTERNQSAMYKSGSVNYM